MRKDLLTQNIILAIAGLAVPFFVLFMNIFPNVSLSYGSLNEFGYGFVERQIQDNRFLVASPSNLYPFTKASLSLDVDGKDRQKETKIALIKDYITNMYPVGEPITDAQTLKRLLYQDNPSGIPNGALYTRGETVFVISRGYYYPVLSPQAFETMGYKWDTLAPIGGDAFAQLQEGEGINQMSVHPDGTILKTSAGAYLLVWEGKRHPVDYDALASAWRSVYWVDVVSQDANKLGECVVPEGEDELACVYRFRKELMAVPGRTFFITIDPWPSRPIAQGSVRLSTAVTSDTDHFKLVLGQIKSNLFNRYAEYFF